MKIPLSLLSHTNRELIDTLWNVNKNTMELKEIESRINRYIMECKLLFGLFSVATAI